MERAKIWQLSVEEIDMLRDAFSDRHQGDVVEVWMDVDGFKARVNYGIWSPPMGRRVQ